MLRQVLAVAVSDRRLAVNPAAGVAQPRLPLGDQRFLTAADLARLAGATASERDRMLILVLGWTGLRFGEVAGLTRGDLDILRRRIRIERAIAEVRGVVHIGSPKSHAARTVAMPSFLADELGRYMEAIPTASDSLIFASAASTYLRVTTWKRRVFDTAARAANLTPPALRVHDLRHTAASLSIASGASVKLVQRQLGHRSATLTLDTYSHLFADDLDALSSALDGLNTRTPADSVRIPDGAGDVVSLRA